MDYGVKFAFVTGLMFVVYVCWAKYTLAVQHKQAMHSGVWSVSAMLCTALVTVSYVEDKSLIIAAAIGTFAGTYYTVVHDLKKTKKIQSDSSSKGPIV